MGKKVLVCLHGLMNHDDHDIHYFKEYIDSSLKKDEEVILSYQYNHDDHRSYKYKRQVKALDRLLQDQFAQGNEVSILGYSYSNSLVAKFAKKYQFKKVVLVSPTYKFFDRELLSNYIKVIAKSWKMKWKYRKNKKAKAKLKKANLNHVVSLILNVYKCLILNRKKYKYITCPVLMYRGTSDAIVTPHSFYKCSKKISSDNIGVSILPNFTHTFIRHEDDCTITTNVWNDIYRFVFKDS